MGPTGCPKSRKKNYQHTLHNIPEERKPQPEPRSAVERFSFVSVLFSNAERLEFEKRSTWAITIGSTSELIQKTINIFKTWNDSIGLKHMKDCNIRRTTRSNRSFVHWRALKLAPKSRIHTPPFLYRNKLRNDRVFQQFWCIPSSFNTTTQEFNIHVGTIFL